MCLFDNGEDVNFCYIDITQNLPMLKIYTSMYQFHRMKNATDQMLDCLRHIPQVTLGMVKLLQYILKAAKVLTAADRCSVWLKRRDK